MERAIYLEETQPHIKCEDTIFYSGQTDGTTPGAGQYAWGHIRTQSPSNSKPSGTLTSCKFYSTNGYNNQGVGGTYMWWEEASAMNVLLDGQTSNVSNMKTITNGVQGSYGGCIWLLAQTPIALVGGVLLNLPTYWES